MCLLPSIRFGSHEEGAPCLSRMVMKGESKYRRRFGYGPSELDWLQL